MAPARFPAAAALALCGLWLQAPPPAGASACSLDNAPAATLLLPYFEVNLDDPYGQTTLFSIANASAAATLAHVVLWTDRAVPTISFDVYLTGYDVQSINLRDVLAFGRLPRTADLAEDAGDLISPKGQLSQDATFPNCSGLPPGPLSAPILANVQAAHTGAPLPLQEGLCSGATHNDHVARGYVTVDAVKGCSNATPADQDYFGFIPGQGIASNANVLWGDYFYVDSRRAYSQGGSLVRIEADPAAFKAGDATFYEVYVNRQARDARQPLPTTWAARFLNGGPFDAGSDMIVWREPAASAGPFACQQGAFFGPPVMSGVVFDEQEFPGDPTGCTGPPDICSPMRNAVPNTANRTPVGGPAFAVPFSFGWYVASFQQETPPGAAWAPRQAWLGTAMNAHQLISVAMPGTPLDSGCDATAPVPGATPPPPSP